MVFIRLTTTKTLTLKQEKSIQESIRKLISNLSHQEEQLMIHIEDNQVMYLNGQEIDCIHMECQFNKVNFNQQEFDFKLKESIEKITKIPTNYHMIFINK